MHPFRTRPSYANIVSTLALVIAVGGGTAWAATHDHYAITSTSQIKPDVLHRLRGQRGANGATGAPGAAGSVGAEGATGPTGPTGVAGIVTATPTRELQVTWREAM
jgi:hypothetical protein